MVAKTDQRLFYKMKFQKKMVLYLSAIYLFLQYFTHLYRFLKKSFPSRILSFKA